MITMTKNEVKTNIFFVLSNNTCIKASESVQSHSGQEQGVKKSVFWLCAHGCPL